MWWGSKNPKGLKVTVRIFNLIPGENGNDWRKWDMVWHIFSEEVLNTSYSVKSSEMRPSRKVHRWTRKVIIDRKKNRQIWDISLSSELL